MVMLLAHLQKSHAVTLIVGDNDLTLSEVSVDYSGVRAGRLNIPFRVVEYVVANNVGYRAHTVRNFCLVKQK